MGASLTEESLPEILGCKTSRAAFLALEVVFAHALLSRANQLRAELFALQRDAMTVDEFARKFKYVCDQLAAIGRPIYDIDKIH